MAQNWSPGVLANRVSRLSLRTSGHLLPHLAFSGNRTLSGDWPGSSSVTICKIDMKLNLLDLWTWEQFVTLKWKICVHVQESICCCSTDWYFGKNHYLSLTFKGQYVRILLENIQNFTEIIKSIWRISSFGIMMYILCCRPIHWG